MKTTKSSASEELQGWWVQHPIAWEAASDAVYEKWCQQERTKTKLPPDVARAALAFGFHGRLHYGERRDWVELVDQLQLDWSAAGHQTAWKRARLAVKAGWTAAQVPSEAQSPPKRDGQERSADGTPEPAESRVHGGRMINHGS